MEGRPSRPFIYEIVVYRTSGEAAKAIFFMLTKRDNHNYNLLYFWKGSD